MFKPTMSSSCRAKCNWIILSFLRFKTFGQNSGRPPETSLPLDLSSLIPLVYHLVTYYQATLFTYCPYLMCSS